jgi:hypothetical protein
VAAAAVVGETPEMARILFSAYMVRYPTGGMMSGALQYMLGLARLGHEVTLVERAGWESSCWNPSTREESDDCAYGVDVVDRFLRRFGLERFCYLDIDGRQHGTVAGHIDEAFERADAFVEFGCIGEWAEEMAAVPVTAFIEGEPGRRHIELELERRRGVPPTHYDHYFTNGCHVGTPASGSPTAGLEWVPVVSPVDTAPHLHAPPPRGSTFSTVMNWQALHPVEFEGVRYGQKDVEFANFETLPSLAPDARFAVAVSGPATPRARLEELGWHQLDADDVTISYDSYLRFLDASLGEFSVAKHAFVALNTGWFSERSGVYLARGRPVVVQDTGFGEYLPTGEGLFAVRTVDEAAAAVEEVLRDPARHSRAARELAREHLEAASVMAGVADRMGLT